MLIAEAAAAQVFGGYPYTSGLRYYRVAYYPDGLALSDLQVCFAASPGTASESLVDLTVELISLDTQESMIFVRPALVGGQWADRGLGCLGVQIPKGVAGRFGFKIYLKSNRGYSTNDWHPQIDSVKHRTGGLSLDLCYPSRGHPDWCEITFQPVQESEIEIALTACEITLEQHAEDEDNDGIPDLLLDECPGSLPEVPVDARGCSVEQFCASARIEEDRSHYGHCRRLDWSNDEPWMRSSDRDCTVDFRETLARDDDRCVPAEWGPFVRPTPPE